MSRDQHVLGDQRNHGRLDQRPDSWSREGKEEIGKTGEVGRGQAMWGPFRWAENFDL